MRRGVAEEIPVSFIISLNGKRSISILVGVYIDRASFRKRRAKSIRFGPRVMGRRPDGSYW